MSRFLVVLLIFAIAVAVFPSLREWLKPKAELVARPAYRQYTSWRIDEITRVLEQQIERGRPLPSPRRFSVFLDSAFLGESSSRDAWGTPYYLKREPFAVRVGSAGPDRKVGTDDDLLSKAVATGQLHVPDF